MVQAIAGSNPVSSATTLKQGKTDMGKLEHYSIGKRNLKIPEIHWETLDSETFRVTKPTVLVFGGNASLRPKDANYMCRVGQSLIGLKDPQHTNETGTTRDVDFVGIGYGNNETTGYGKNQKMSDTSELTEEEIAELANNIFTPFYLDDHMQIRPETDILRNFSQVTFFAHCHGAREVTALIQKVRENMQSIGINSTTVNAAIGQLYAVTYAPRRMIPCPGLQVIPEKDNTIKTGPSHAPIAQEFLERRSISRYQLQGEGTVAFKENADVISLVVSSMSQATDEHSINFIERDDDWQMIEPDLVYGKEVSTAMGVALAYAIAGSIRNMQEFTPRPNADTMLGHIQSILGTSQNQTFMQGIEQIKEI